MSSFSKRERKREVSFCFGVVVVVVVFFVVERKREESKVESVVVVVLVVVALSRGKESSLGRLSHPLHPKEREKRKKKKKKTHKTHNRGCFLVFFFASFLLFFWPNKSRPKSYLFRSNVIQKPKEGLFRVSFYFAS